MCLMALPPKVLSIFLQGWKQTIKVQPKYGQIYTDDKDEAQEPDEGNNIHEEIIEIISFISKSKSIF